MQRGIQMKIIFSKHKEGDTRVVTIFPLTPIILDNQLIWLEKVRVVQVLERRVNTFFNGDAILTWCNKSIYN